MTRSLLLTMILGACAYDTHFEDCAVRCTTDVGCPLGLTCEAEGLCRTPGATEACTEVLDTFPSCTGLAATCGPNADEDCCSTAMPIPGGTFYRSHDVAVDGAYPSMGYPATVSPFLLDRFEVTVGRFRAFVDAGMGTQASAPALGAGGRTLNGMAAQGGWDASWNASLSIDAATLKTDLKSCPFATWTDLAGASENLAINCITWYEAHAFCVWNGGYLPTEAEWNYAASGGSEQRAYPWSSPPSSLTIDCSYANYSVGGTASCTNGLRRVGSTSPKGDGKFGHSDLSGNAWEWTLDWAVVTYPTSNCDDCANLVMGIATGRVSRGGGFSYGEPYQRANYRGGNTPSPRGYFFGVRCARSAH